MRLTIIIKYSNLIHSSLNKTINILLHFHPLKSSQVGTSSLFFTVENTGASGRIKRPQNDHRTKKNQRQQPVSGLLIQRSEDRTQDARGSK